MPVNRGEYEYLESLQKEFSRAMMDSCRTEHGVSARAEFNRNLQPYECLAIATAKFRYGIAVSGDYDYDTKAAAMMDLCDISVPCLIRTFGEAAILAAIPERARNSETVALCDRAGAPRCADLILKVIEH